MASRLAAKQSQEDADLCLQWARFSGVVTSCPAEPHLVAYVDSYNVCSWMKGQASWEDMSQATRESMDLVAETAELCSGQL